MEKVLKSEEKRWRRNIGRKGKREEDGDERELEKVRAKKERENPSTNDEENDKKKVET